MKIEVDQEGMIAIAAVCDISLGLARLKALAPVNRVLSNVKVSANEPPPAPAPTTP